MNEVLRYFFRCHDCLSVFAIEKAVFNQDRGNLHDRWETPEGDEIVCPCSGEVHFMGPVTRHHVYETVDMPACDGRCTEAKGNCCDCICGGVNHGTGRVAVLSFRKDIDAPKVKGVDYEYGASVRARRKAIKEPFAEELAMIDRGERVWSKERWWKATKTRELLSKAYWAFTKASRENIFKQAEELNGSMTHSNV